MIKQAERTLQHLIDFDSIMNRVLSDFATCALQDIDASVENGLESIARFIGADHAYIVMLSPDRSTRSATHEWCAPNVTPVKHKFQGLPMGTMPWAERKILGGEIMRIHSLDDFPKEEASLERLAFQEEGAASVLDVPIRDPSGRTVGCIGVHAHACSVSWSEDDVLRLRMIGDTIASLLERKRIEQALDETRAQVLAIVNSTNDFIWCVDPLNFGLVTWNKAFGDYFLQTRGIELRIGMPPEQLVPGDFVALWNDLFSRALREGSFVTDYIVVAGTNTLLLSFNLLKRNGEVFAISIFGKDITERKRMEMELQQRLQEIEALKNRLEAESAYLQEEIKLEHNFENIIGQSDVLKYVFYRVQQVASTDMIVLILGETGTGKELVARAIHETSPRSARPMVKVNCAVLPASLIESELFGHEKGAFTGAAARKLGRFELANNTTLFLDEIGELPLDLQAKFLRVLEEGEFERVGGTQTIKVNVRVIAATNRDLEKEMKEGRFRSNLWYRLNVYPITVPALRERTEDIPLMVAHFVEQYGKRFGKNIKKIPAGVMESLKSYSWPGNVRELKHVIERAVINSSESTLRLAESLSSSSTPPAPAIDEDRTLEEMERQYILHILEKTDWKIEGQSGAAEILNIIPSTLRSRMKKLGIRKNHSYYSL